MRAAALLVLATLTFLPGCVEFESQVILLHRDREANVIRARLLYRGISIGDEEDREALAAFVQHPTLCLLDPLLTIDLRTAEELTDPEREERTEEPAAIAALRRRATLANGSFHLDRNGRTCGWQDLTIRDAEGFLRELNSWISEEVLSDPEFAAGASEGTRELLRTAAEKGHAWLVWDDSGVNLRFPVTPGDVRRLKEGFLARLAGEGADDDEVESRVRMLTRNRFSWVQLRSGLVVTLAPGEGGVVRAEHYRRKAGPDLVGPNGEGAEKLPARFVPGLTDEQVEADFRKLVAEED